MYAARVSGHHRAHFVQEYLAAAGAGEVDGEAGAGGDGGGAAELGFLEGAALAVSDGAHLPGGEGPAVPAEGYGAGRAVGVVADQDQSALAGLPGVHGEGDRGVAAVVQGEELPAFHQGHLWRGIHVVHGDLQEVLLPGVENQLRLHVESSSAAAGGEMKAVACLALHLPGIQIGQAHRAVTGVSAVVDGVAGEMDGGQHPGIGGGEGDGEGFAGVLDLAAQGKGLPDVVQGQRLAAGGPSTFFQLDHALCTAAPPPGEGLAQHPHLVGHGLPRREQRVVIIGGAEQSAAQAGRRSGGPGGFDGAGGVPRGLAQPVLDVGAHLVKVLHHDPVLFLPLGQVVIFCVVHEIFSFVMFGSGKKPLHLWV